MDNGRIAHVGTFAELVARGVDLSVYTRAARNEEALSTVAPPLTAPSPPAASTPTTGPACGLHASRDSLPARDAAGQSTSAESLLHRLAAVVSPVSPSSPGDAVGATPQYAVESEGSSAPTAPFQKVGLLAKDQWSSQVLLLRNCHGGTRAVDVCGNTHLPLPFSNLDRWIPPPSFL